MTNFLAFIERVRTAQALWTFVLPTVALPPNETWVRWLSSASDAEFESAVLKVPKRYRGQYPADAEVYKFVSSVLANLRDVRRAGGVA